MMNRRQFIASSAATLSSTVLTIPTLSTVGIDMASGPSQTVIFMSTPTTSHSWLHELHSQANFDVARATGVSWEMLRPDSKDIPE